MQTENTAERLADFHGGSNFYCYRQFGLSFETDKSGNDELVFRTFAPGDCVKNIFLVGDFNGWSETHPMKKITDGGVFEARVEYKKDFFGTYYKYKIVTFDGTVLFKADPFAVYCEKCPKTASVIYKTKFAWNDEKYLHNRKNSAGRYGYSLPLNIYELHLGSWKRNVDGSFMSYSDAADELIPYLKQLGYTHIKLLPIAEHPFDGSLGYQTTGFFAPTSRFGTPDDFRAFVDRFHAAGLGIIADIDISSFPKDEHGLFEFDGSHVYEYSDESKREHKVRKTARFDFSRAEVVAFVMSVLNFWTDEFHLDGICVCGIDSILDPECDRALNRTKDVSRNPSCEGEIFLNNLCKYFSENHNDIILLSDHQNAQFGFTHFFSSKPAENFVHPSGNFEDMFSKGLISGISHDICGMLQAGEKALSRLLLTYITSLPGGKITFMGTEAANRDAWIFYKGLDWEKLLHRGLEHLLFVRDLNWLYLSHPVLWSFDDSENSLLPLYSEREKAGVFAFARINPKGEAYKELLVVFNVSEKRYEGYAQNLHKKADCIQIFSTNSGKANENCGLIRCDRDLFVKIDLEPYSAYIFEMQS